MSTPTYKVFKPQVSIRMYWPEAAFVLGSLGAPVVAWLIWHEAQMLSRSGSLTVVFAGVAEFITLNRMNKKHLLNACRVLKGEQPWDFSRAARVVGVICLFAALLGTALWGFGDLLVAQPAASAAVVATAAQALPAGQRMVADPWAVLGTIALAMASGAGGSAFFELWWKPRQNRRKAATLVVAEMLLNTELQLMHAHARIQRPKIIPGDFHMSTLGWETAAGTLVELPARTLKSLLLLYGRYRHLNSCIPQFDLALRDIQTHAPGSAERQKAERHADVIVDVFNTGIDAAIDHAQELQNDLFKLAGLKPDREMDVEALKRKVTQLLVERERRVRG